MQALAVCWQSGRVHYLDLSRAHSSREVEEGSSLRQRVSAILGRPGSHKLCYDATQLVQLLLEAGERMIVEDRGLCAALNPKLCAAL